MQNDTNRRFNTRRLFFASNTSFNTKRPGFVPDRYLLKNRQLLSLRNPENGAIFAYATAFAVKENDHVA
ncbi:membrane protein YoeI [Salmonella enterica subsp. enterica serovar Infantis]|nr:membrane protein YoeI [Salmonella enterica subsp. enterica serovar Infantis]